MANMAFDWSKKPKWATGYVFLTKRKNLEGFYALIIDEWGSNLESRNHNVTFDIDDLRVTYVAQPK